MIGSYGHCADLSRSWVCGHRAVTAQQRRLYRTALEQIEHNLTLLRPGLEFREFNELSWRVAERHLPNRYTLAVHGVGLADEWPAVLLHPDFAHNHRGCFEENMAVCVESRIAAEGSASVKLETQALITATGAERLDSFPWEEV
jgi:Xaa-Pro aminopeptidase